mmetsp:Transcript_7842/g.32775  ORF Transcript_7842/g.32775 Transcript_7842/m.32775 type:complete len:243 (-) Transcript_7842:525-1253(-)
MRHSRRGASKFSTTGMHPSPCSTRMRSHSDTGVSGATATRSFMYPETGRSSWPLIAATSTSVMDTTPSNVPPASEASVPSLPPLLEITGQLRWSLRSSKSPSSPMVMSGGADTTRLARLMTSRAVFCGGICVWTMARTSASKMPSTSPAARHASMSSRAATQASWSSSSSSFDSEVASLSVSRIASSPPRTSWSMRNAADAALGCPPPPSVRLRTLDKSTPFTGLARPMTETCLYGFFLPCT